MSLNINKFHILGGATESFDDANMNMNGMLIVAMRTPASVTGTSFTFKCKLPGMSTFLALTNNDGTVPTVTHSATLAEYILMESGLLSPLTIGDIRIVASAAQSGETLLDGALTAIAQSIVVDATSTLLSLRPDANVVIKVDDEYILGTVFDATTITVVLRGVSPEGKAGGSTPAAHLDNAAVKEVVEIILYSIRVV